MARQIVLRDVPDDIHAVLRRRAGRRGLSLEAYLLDELQRQARRPDLDEWLTTLAELEPASASETGAEAVERSRDDDDALVVADRVGA